MRPKGIRRLKKNREKEKKSGRQKKERRLGATCAVAITQNRFLPMFDRETIEARRSLREIACIETRVYVIRKRYVYDSIRIRFDFVCFAFDAGTRWRALPLLHFLIDLTNARLLIEEIALRVTVDRHC